MREKIPYQETDAEIIVSLHWEKSEFQIIRDGISELLETMPHPLRGFSEAIKEAGRAIGNEHFIE